MREWLVLGWHVPESYNEYLNRTVAERQMLYEELSDFIENHGSKKQTKGM